MTEQLIEKDKWRFLKAVIQTGEDLSNDPEFEQDYNPWFITRNLSYFKDTISFADQINRLPSSKKEHFLYLLHIVPKRKRFAKMHYSVQDENLKSIMEYYQCNEKKAKEIKIILKPENIKQIRDYKGGVVK